MAAPIRMPDLGATVEAATLIAWFEREGESVPCGEPLCEVETDKATDQLESVAAGVLPRRVVRSNREIPTVDLTASIDMSCVNGAEAAAFLKHLKETLETL